jgi:hypothetical protein
VLFHRTGQFLSGMRHLHLSLLLGETQFSAPYFLPR